MLKMRKLTRRILAGGKKQASAKAPFPGVEPYWEKRYSAGGASGAGSVGRLAQFKAHILNEFVEKHSIKTILELGCGDGSQLALAHYPNYVGIDLSKTAIERCRDLFRDDPTKRFFHTSESSEYQGTYDLVLSLDVIYHLVEDAVYANYMLELEKHARTYIIIYSSDREEDSVRNSGWHVRHRKFSDHFERHPKDWSLLCKVDNHYPLDPADQENTTFADFYIYERCHNI
jgi:SAM-dependent methyltransferase